MRHSVFLRAVFFALFVASLFVANTGVFASEEKGKTVILFDNKEYVESNFDDLSKASVIFGAVSLSNQRTLDEYAVLNHCEIYRDYFQNDIEWLEVSKAIKDNFQRTAQNVPRRFFFKSEIYLDRYNSSTKSFPLIQESRFNRIGILEFFTLRGKRTCLNIMQPTQFASTYSLRVPTPITIESLKVDSREMLEKISELPFWRGEQKRVVMVFYVELLGFVGNTTDSATFRTTFSGQINGISFYADDNFQEHLKTITNLEDL